MKIVVTALVAVLLATLTAVTQDKPASKHFFIDFALYGTADLWRHADAVVYLRIEDTKPWAVGRIAEFGGLSVLHTATVLDVVKTHPIGGPTGQTITFVQAGSTDEPAYAKGGKFIAFLNWSPDVFVRSSGPSSVYAVKQDKVDWLNVGRDIPYSTETLTVEDFITRLRELARVGLATVTPGQWKPTQLIIANTEFREPPPSLREMVETAEAVVVGRVGQGVSKDAGFYHKTDPGIVTFYQVHVTEVLRWPGDRPLAENELTIVRDGGAIDRGSAIEKLEVDEFRQPFSLGREYVLFLRWHGEHDAWTPAWGPHGTFEVIEGCVRSVGSARIAKEQDGLSIDHLIAKLRALAKESR